MTHLLQTVILSSSAEDTCFSGFSEHPALTFHLPAHKSVRAHSRKRVEPLTREGASTAASPSEPSYLLFLPCDRHPQLLHGRPDPSLSKHGTHPESCSVVAAYYLGTLPRPLQRDTICTIVVAFDTNPSSAVLCVRVCGVCRWCVQASDFLCGVPRLNKVDWIEEDRIEFPVFSLTNKVWMTCF